MRVWFAGQLPCPCSARNSFPILLNYNRREPGCDKLAMEGGGAGTTQVGGLRAGETVGRISRRQLAAQMQQQFIRSDFFRQNVFEPLVETQFRVDQLSAVVDAVERTLPGEHLDE